MGKNQSKKTNKLSSDRMSNDNKQVPTSSIYKTTNNRTYVLQSNNRQNVSQSKNNRNRRSSLTPLQQSKSPDNSSRRRSSVGKLSPPQMPSSQPNKSSEGNNSNAKQKPKFVVSHLPHQPLPIYYKK